MASCVFGEIEESATCACCERAFDENERAPPPAGGSREAHCLHRRKPTERLDSAWLARHLAAFALPADGDGVEPKVCATRVRRGYDTRAAHALRPSDEARALLSREVHALNADLERATLRRREFLLRTLDAVTALKFRLEGELKKPPTAASPDGVAVSLAAERDRLRARLYDALLQNRLDDLVRTATAPLDAEAVRRSLAGSAVADSLGEECRDPLLFLANYCTVRLSAEGPPAPSPLARLPTGYPLFYFELEVNGAAFGRIVVEAREDLAPRMTRNFSALVTGELGVGYRGCAVFRCWENESVIAGDFELNDGRGGRSAFEESYFMPDDTGMMAVRGSVGMRRSQKRRDNLGLVGSQFRVMLREMRGFTAIFASVVEGLELVDRLSRTGDGAGKPRQAILISDCGKLN